jgi:hypothetical protein
MLVQALGEMVQRGFKDEGVGEEVADRTNT